MLVLRVLAVAAVVVVASALCEGGGAPAAAQLGACSQFQDQNPVDTCCSIAQAAAAEARIAAFATGWRDTEDSCCFNNLILLSCVITCSTLQDDFTSTVSSTEFDIVINQDTAATIYNSCKDLCTDESGDTKVSDDYANAAAFFAALEASINTGTATVDDPDLNLSLTAASDATAIVAEPTSTKYELLLSSACGPDTIGCGAYPSTKRDSSGSSTAVRDWILIGVGTVVVFAGIFVVSMQIGNKLFTGDEEKASLTKEAKGE